MSRRGRSGNPPKHSGQRYSYWHPRRGAAPGIPVHPHRFRRYPHCLTSPHFRRPTGFQLFPLAHPSRRPLARRSLPSSHQSRRRYPLSGWMTSRSMNKLPCKSQARKSRAVETSSTILQPMPSSWGLDTRRQYNTRCTFSFFGVASCFEGPAPRPYSPARGDLRGGSKGFPARVLRCWGRLRGSSVVPRSVARCVTFALETRAAGAPDRLRRAPALEAE